MSTNRPSKELPVIIAGAGPCGLVAALTLKQEGVPFVIVERTERAKVCSNAGSGFDLASSAMEILCSRLNVHDTETIIKSYTGVYFEDMNGKVIRDMFFRTTGEHASSSVNRAELQNLLLDQLFPATGDEENVLKCGLAVSSYETKSDHVVVKLSDGSAMNGSVLLGCDGIRSGVRKCLLGGEAKDPMNFCNNIAYWGKCPLGGPGSKMGDAIRSTQTYATEGGSSVVIGLGTRRNPGSFFVVPLNDTAVWAIFLKSNLAPVAGEDLTRRGGRVLDETGKERLLNSLKKSNGLARLCIEETEAADITQAGLFDRKNLDLPYSDGNRVALLGDAAHPQTPFLGQGANMSIVDAYVICTRIAKQSAIQTAIQAFDTKVRRKGAKQIVKEARVYAKYGVSANWWTIWIFRLFVKLCPPSIFASMDAKGDKSNQDFIAAMDYDLAGSSNAISK